MSNILSSVFSVVPIFILIIFGIILRRFNFLNDDFIKKSNKIIFTFALPATLFQKMRSIESVPSELFGGIGVFLAATIITVFVTWIILRKYEHPMRASALQGSFRSNVAIVGLAVVQNLLSDSGVAVAIVVIAFTMPVYNILCIIVLGDHSEQKPHQVLLNVIIKLIKNPLFLSLAAGLLFSLIKIPVHSVIDSSLNYLSRMTLPLALLCVGGSLQLSSLIHGRVLWGVSSLMKLVLLPLLVFAACRLLNYSNEMTAVLVLLAGNPTAVSTFAMADGFGADTRLAGEIISVTTIFSIITMSLWIAVLI